MGEDDDDDPRLRLRCFIDGKLIDETWLDAGNPDSEGLFAKTLRRHMDLVNAAQHQDVPWLIETYDPARPKEEAYQRIGTDTGGMVDPKPLREQP